MKLRISVTKGEIWVKGGFPRCKHIKRGTTATMAMPARTVVRTVENIPHSQMTVTRHEVYVHRWTAYRWSTATMKGVTKRGDWRGAR